MALQSVIWSDRIKDAIELSFYGCTIVFCLWGFSVVIPAMMGQSQPVIPEPLRLKYQLSLKDAQMAAERVDFAQERLAAAQQKLNDARQAQIQACRDALASVKLELGKDGWTCAADGGAVKQPEEKKTK